MVEPNGTVKAKNFSGKCRYLTIKDNEKCMFIDDPPEPAPPLDPVESIFLRDYNTGFSLLSAKTAADFYLSENNGIIWADGVWYKTNQYGIYERYSTNGAAGDVHMRKSVQEYLSSTIERFLKNYMETKEEEPARIDFYQKSLKLAMDYDFPVKVTNIIKGEVQSTKMDEFMDENPYLVGFRNGVYDLKAKEFRIPTKDEYVSMTVGYNHVEPDEEKMNEFFKIFDDMFETVHVTNYMLKVLSTCLVGLPPDCQYSFFLIGKGSNGKSIIDTFISKLLGDYYHKPKPSFIYGSDNNQQGHSGNTLALKNKRASFISELDEHAEIVTSSYKAYTGGDKHSGRETGGPGHVHFFQKYTPLMSTNYPPKFDSHGESTLRRVIVIPFVYKFLVDPDPDNPNHKKANTDLDNKQEYYQSNMIHFFHLLVKFYGMYEIEGIAENVLPEQIKNETELVRLQVDPVKYFVRTALVFTGDENNHISNQDIVRKYNDMAIPNNRKRTDVKKMRQVLIDFGMFHDKRPTINGTKVSSVGVLGYKWDTIYAGDNEID